MLDKYKLSESKHEKIFNRLKLNLFLGKTPVENPQIFILGGQPGAGKSVLTKRIHDTFNDPNVVVINSDDYRTLHPQAQEIFALYDKDFAAYTDPDVRVWGKRVFDEAIAGHYNIIFEGTMRTPMICDTIKHLQAEGYKINILALAVPEVESRISIYARYQEQLDNYPLARFTSRFSHDAAYYGMLDTLRQIEDEHLYDTINVYNRAGDIVFQTGDKDIVSAIERERKKPLSRKDILRYTSLCNVLLQKMSVRNEPEEYVNDLLALREQVVGDNQDKDLNESIEQMHATVKKIKTPVSQEEQRPSAQQISIPKNKISR